MNDQTRSAEAVSVDAGGTFVDVVVAGSSNRRTTCRGLKLLANSGDVVGVALRYLAEQGKMSSSHRMLYTTTLATNALVTGRKARIALITTRGFRDVIELRRQSRANLYDIAQEPPRLLVPRASRYEIGERVEHNGQISKPVDVGEVLGVAEELLRRDVDSVAVSLLFSFVNRGNEETVAKTLEQRIPGIRVYMSSDIAPIAGEFERTSTTVAAAYVASVLKSDLNNVRDQVESLGLAPAECISSDGTRRSLDEVIESPIHLVESGPAAGAMGVAAVARWLEIEHALAFDVGGTTAKACLIDRWRLVCTRHYEVGGSCHKSIRSRGGGCPVAIPVADLIEIGIGGGSIVRVDAGKALHVGPESAEAVPGPAAYGQGGDRATVTDAAVVAGLVDGAGSFGGRLPVNADAAHNAISRGVGHPLGLSIYDAASSVLAVAEGEMADLVHSATIRRGIDPRRYTLIAFGGAGPIHAAAVAEKLGIERVVIPPLPACFGALGSLLAGRTDRFERPVHRLLSDVSASDLAEILRALRADLRGTADGSEALIEWSASMRYQFQKEDLTIEFEPRGQAHRLATLFSRKYEKTFGFSLPHELVNLTSVSVTAVRPRRETELVADMSAKRRHNGVRVVHRGRRGGASVPVLTWWDLDHAVRPGPVLVDSYDTTVVVPERWQVRRNKTGCLDMTWNCSR